MTKLLSIEDDATLARGLAANLELLNYDVRIAANGLAGLQLVSEWEPNLVLLDVMMPGMDGWEVCRRLRKITDTPIIMLTARGMRQDVIQGLSTGADDYVRKPFDMQELELRIKAVLRRSQPQADDNVELFDDGQLQIDLERRLVKCGGQPVHLTPTEFRLLAHLVHRLGHVVPHEELVRAVWGPNYADETANLGVYIRYLREKLEVTPSSPQYICTEWGIGYRFTAAPKPDA
jgi:two-component system, OmpR family, KDP operon response regulator KdpE